MFEFIDVTYKDIICIPSLVIEKQKVTTLVGTSGSGKTTILRMLNKMISPTKGKILYNGVDLQQLNSVNHRRDVVMLSQNPVIFEGSIRDNLTIGLNFQNKDIPKDEVLKQMLERVSLTKELDSSVSNLSGGEKQRIALARILLLSPKVFLFDEPSSSLDNETEEILIQMLIEYVRNESKTIIMATHSKIIAEKYSDKLIKVQNFAK